MPGEPTTGDPANGGGRFDHPPPPDPHQHDRPVGPFSDSPEDIIDEEVKAAGGTDLEPEN